MTVRILAIDLTSECGSLALVSEPRASASDLPYVVEVAIQSKDGFSHVMFDPIHALLRNNGWPLNSIDCFAVAHGPGSFTGVRVGVAAAKGFAAAMGKPIICVSNLRAIASYGSSPVRAAILDAHREQIYGGVYNADLDLIGEELVIKPAAWLESLPKGIEFVSAETVMFAAWAPKITIAPRALAGAIGRIAARDFKAGKAIDPAAADANYVRRSDAEMFVSSYRPLQQNK